MLKTATSLVHRPFHAEPEGAFIHAPLPPPMLKDNYEPSHPSCFFSEKIRELGMPDAETRGFTWKNALPGDKTRAKWGFYATDGGAVLRLRLDPIGVLAPEQLAAGIALSLGRLNTDGPEILVSLFYLRSYSGMGKAKGSCEGGCSCSFDIDAQHAEKISPVVSMTFGVSTVLNLTTGELSSEQCVLVVTVLDESSSDGRHFKVVGLTQSNGMLIAYENPGGTFLSDIDAQRSRGSGEGWVSQLVRQPSPSTEPEPTQHRSRASTATAAAVTLTRT
ncbi:hypothetical protein FOA52_008049 [Chlamydomonas sp. UWO 241]|nr:hypothetical protein FOA52_008049 [Chlamydomonas sp. UWO 241]